MSEPELVYLYRTFDDHDRPLYIGISDDPYRRLVSQHAYKAWWWGISDITMEVHDTRRAALDAETAAIKAELPIVNGPREPGPLAEPWRPRFVDSDDELERGINHSHAVWRLVERARVYSWWNHMHRDSDPAEALRLWLATEERASVPGVTLRLHGYSAA